MFEVSGYSDSSEISKIKRRTLRLQAGMVRACLNHHDSFVTYTARRQVLKSEMKGCS